MQVKLDYWKMKFHLRLSIRLSIFKMLRTELHHCRWVGDQICRLSKSHKERFKVHVSTTSSAEPDSKLYTIKNISKCRDMFIELSYLSHWNCTAKQTLAYRPTYVQQFRFSPNILRVNTKIIYLVIFTRIDSVPCFSGLIRALSRFFSPISAWPHLSFCFLSILFNDIHRKSWNGLEVLSNGMEWSLIISYPIYLEDSV